MTVTWSPGTPLDQPLDGVLLGKLRVNVDEEVGEAIEQLTYFPGGASGCPHNLLVLGGQMVDMPSALTILPLECLLDSSAHVRRPAALLGVDCISGASLCVNAVPTVHRLDRAPCLSGSVCSPPQSQFHWYLSRGFVTLAALYAQAVS